MAEAHPPTSLHAATEGTGKTRFHVVKGRFAACGAQVLLGPREPAAGVPAELRCRKSVCHRLFAGADQDARSVMDAANIEESSNG